MGLPDKMGIGCLVRADCCICGNCLGGQHQFGDGFVVNASVYLGGILQSSTLCGSMFVACQSSQLENYWFENLIWACKKIKCLTSVLMELQVARIQRNGIVV
eukprot:5748517-Karenia_brevis.AAC.1